MARARNIKPSFFSNDELADIDPLGRLLFIGLWTLADREGRLEDRPRRIKAEVLPYDDCDVDSLLGDLQKSGFILRYAADENQFIQVVNFAKHQNPHVKESTSNIPAPVEHGASTVQARCNEQPKPEQARLIPDSGFPLTDSSITNPNGLVVASDAADQPPAKPDCPHQQIIALYHEVLPMCPRVRDWTPARATQLRARWNEDESRQSLDYWRRFFEYVKSCDFLVGLAGKNPFFADLEWMTKAGNFAKIREAKYENKVAA